MPGLSEVGFFGGKGLLAGDGIFFEDVRIFRLGRGLFGWKEGYLWELEE